VERQSDTAWSSCSVLLPPRSLTAAAAASLAEERGWQAATMREFWGMVLLWRREGS